MLPHLTLDGMHKRTGLDDGYHGRPRKPLSQIAPLLDAYLTGYKSGQNQRLLEVKDGTHRTLFVPKGETHARPRQARPR